MIVFRWYHCLCCMHVSRSFSLLGFAIVTVGGQTTSSQFFPSPKSCERCGRRSVTSLTPCKINSARRFSQELDWSRGSGPLRWNISKPIALQQQPVAWKGAPRKRGQKAPSKVAWRGERKPEGSRPPYFLDHHQMMHLMPTMSCVRHSRQRRMLLWSLK